VKLPYVTVDVFTTQRFGGNPLAVINDGCGVSTEQMQQIAAEFNYSETTFVLPPEDPQNTARVRIFTPRAEVPFAGHPNVGTAFVLAQMADVFGKPPGDTFKFEEAAGLVKIELLKSVDGINGARLKSPTPFEIMDLVSSEMIAACCSLDPADIELLRQRPCIATAGLPFAFAEVTSREALATAKPQHDKFEEFLPAEQAAGICLYCHGGGAVDMQARVFAPLHGVPEDPATGSANVALIGLLASNASVPDGTLERTVAQGVDMGRPSLLFTAAEKVGGTVTATFVGGRCVPVMEGTLTLD